MGKIYDEKKIRENYRTLTEKLIEKGMTITTMESATAGQLISLITDTEGSSAVVKGALVAYSNEAKILQGIPARILEEYSVYSREVAVAMAERCSDVFQADIGVGVTGTTGNIDPANAAASKPGILYFAIHYMGDTYAYKIELEPQTSRLMYKLAMAEEIYEKLKEIV